MYIISRKQNSGPTKWDTQTQPTLLKSQFGQSTDYLSWGKRGYPTVMAGKSRQDGRRDMLVYVIDFIR